MNAPADRPLAGILWMLGAVASLAGLDALGKWIVAVHPAVQLVAVRGGLVLLLMAPLLLRRGGLGALRTRRPWLHGMRAVLTALAVTCFFAGMAYLPLATVITIGFASLLLMTALSVPILGERVGMHGWAAVVVGFCGVLVITRPGGAEFEAALLLPLAASLCFALVGITTRLLTRTETDVSLVLWQNVAMFGLCAPFAVLAWVPMDALDLVRFTVMAVLVVLGQYCMVRAFRSAPVATVAPFQYLELISATAIGYAVWGDVPTLSVGIGAALIVASGLYVLWRERLRRRAGQAGRVADAGALT